MGRSSCFSGPSMDGGAANGSANGWDDGDGAGKDCSAIGWNEYGGAPLGIDSAVSTSCKQDEVGAGGGMGVAEAISPTKG